MKDIPERNTANQPIQFPKMRQDSGFPVTEALFPSTNTIQQQNKDNDDKELDAILNLLPDIPPPSTTSIQTMQQQIYAENTQRINEMSPEEIAKAQREIQDTISPDTLAKIMARLNTQNTKPNQSDIPENRPTTNKDKSVHFADSDEEVPPPLQPIDQDSDSDSGPNPKDNRSLDDMYVDETSQFYKDLKAHYFPNDTLEEKKLEWILNQTQARSPAQRAIDTLKTQTDRAMKNMQSVITGNGQQQELNLLDDPASHLRFGFDGKMVEVIEDIPLSKGLHHHGEDPDAAGYTIPELLHLARSQVPSQRALPLRILGNILHQVNVVGAFDLPIAKAIYKCWLDWEGELYLAEATGKIGMLRLLRLRL